MFGGAPAYGGGGGSFHGVSGPGPSGYGIHRSLALNEGSESAMPEMSDMSAGDNELMLQRERRDTAEERYSGGLGCSKIPQQKCTKIPHKQPRRQCSTVDKPSCHSKPRQVHKQECSDVPQQNCPAKAGSSGGATCVKETVHKCRKVSRRVPRLVGHRVPKRHCERLNQDIAGTGIRLVGVFNSPHGSLGGGGGGGGLGGPALGLGYYP